MKIKDKNISSNYFKKIGDIKKINYKLNERNY